MVFKNVKQYIYRKNTISMKQYFRRYLSSGGYDSLYSGYYSLRTPLSYQTDIRLWGWHGRTVICGCESKLQIMLFKARKLFFIFFCFCFALFCFNEWVFWLYHLRAPKEVNIMMWEEGKWRCGKRQWQWRVGSTSEDEMSHGREFCDSSSCWTI